MTPISHRAVLLLATLAPILLSSAPASAQHGTKGELACSRGIAKTRATLLTKRSKCVQKCLAKARKTAGPYASCLPPFDGATATCIAGAEVKAEGAIVKSCADDCPDCYQPGVCAHPAPIVEAGKDAVADHLKAVYCVEDGGATPTKAEAKCERTVGSKLARLAGARTTCFNECNAAIATGRLNEDRCDPWAVKDPETVACIAKAEAAAVLAIDKACGPSGATPPCHGGATGATWAGTVRPLVDVQVPGKPDWTPCDDGLACTAEDFCYKSKCGMGDPDVCGPANRCALSHCDRRTRSCSPVMPVECPEPLDTMCFVSTCSAATGVCLMRCAIPGACGAGPGPCADAVGCTSDADCDDHNLCTNDSCVGTGLPGAFCSNVPVPCNDGDICSHDFCSDPAGGCLTRRQPPGFCDDFNPGTVDTCEPFVGCVHTTGCGFVGGLVGPITFFNAPGGIAMGVAGGMYVADTQNHRIQVLSAITGSYLTEWGAFGSGMGQFNLPSGVAIDLTSLYVYVADTFNNRIQRFDSAGNYVDEVGSLGTGDGQFDGPRGVATDGAGNIYVADTGNHRLQKFAADASSLTYLTQWGGLGTGDGQLDSPRGVTTDGAGDVYVADTFNHRIQKFDGTGTYLTQWGGLGAGDGQFDTPFGVLAFTNAIGGITVHVADTFNHRIQRFGATGTHLGQDGSFGAGIGQLNRPVGVAFPFQDSGIALTTFVADQLNHRIVGFGPTTSAGRIITTHGGFGSGVSGFDDPADVATDAAGNVYVADTFNHRIQKFDAAGTYLTQWGGLGAGTGQLDTPSSVAADAAGNVYVADTANHRIQKFDAAGTYLTQWGGLGAGTGQFQQPFGVAADAAGNVYVADLNNNRIQKFDSSGTYLTQWGGFGAGSGQFDGPSGVATDAAGNVYVADGNNHRIQKFDGAGTHLTQWGSLGSANVEFVTPADVATDAAGNVYVADTGNDRIQKFTAAGAYLTQWGSSGSGSEQFNGPRGVAADGGGNVYVADTANDRVQNFACP